MGISYAIASRIPKVLLLGLFCASSPASADPTQPSVALSFACNGTLGKRCLAGAFTTEQDVLLAGWDRNTCKTKTGEVFTWVGPEGKETVTAIKDAPGCTDKDGILPLVVLGDDDSVDVLRPTDVTDPPIARLMSSAEVQAHVERLYVDKPAVTADGARILAFGTTSFPGLIQLRYRTYSPDMDRNSGGGFGLWLDNHLTLLDGLFSNTRSMYLLVTAKSAFLAYLAMDKQGCQAIRAIAYEVTPAALVKRLDVPMSRYHTCPPQIRASGSKLG